MFFSKVSLGSVASSKDAECRAFRCFLFQLQGSVGLLSFKRTLISEFSFSAADYYFFTPYIYPASWSEDDIFRQTISLLIVTNLGAYILYFFFATLSYYFVYDHSLMKHPQFLKVSDFLTYFLTTVTVKIISICA